MSDDLICILPVKGDEEWDRGIACWERSIFSSLRYNFFSAMKDGQFFVLRNVSAVHPMIFFRPVFDRIEILHLYSKFSSLEIHAVCQFFFKMFGHIRSVGFDCIESDRGETGFFSQRYDVSEDFVIDLGASVEGYAIRLGKQLQHDLKRFRKKLSSECGDVRCACVPGAEVAEAVFDDIIGFSVSRMAAKEVASSHTLEKSRRLFELVKKFGFVFVIYVDGTMRAGVICTLYGKDMFMHVLAHDPGFDRFRLGKLACYFSICAAIEQGAERYHLLSGRYEYKLRFLGKPVAFDRVEVYRSIGSVLCCLERYLTIFVLGNGRRLKHYLKARGVPVPGWLTAGPAARACLGRMTEPVRRLLRRG